MGDRGNTGGRRTIGIAMGASAMLMIAAAALVLAGLIPVAETSRILVGGVLAAVGVVDLVLAGYFFVSDPS